MTADADFEGYVGARWPLLVRTLVLLGCPEAAAPDVALDALGRCQGRWSRIRAEADVDTVVQRELVAAWDDYRTAGPRWWETEPRETGDPAPTGSADPALAGDLDVLSPDARLELVLARFAGAPSGARLPDEPTTERLHAAAAALPVLAAPTQDEIGVRRREGARRRTRHALRLTLGAGLPVALVVAGLTWLATRTAAPGEPPLARLVATRAANPTNVVWEAGGVLHLPQATVAIPPARQLAPAGSGGLYADRLGRVIEVTDDGTQRLLGHEDVETGFVSSDARQWAAWVDPTGGRAELVAYDLADHRVVDRLPVAGAHRTQPLAIDGDTLYYADRAGTRSWQPGTDRRPTLVTRPGVLVDVVAMTRLYQVSTGRLQVSEPLADATVPIVGVGGRLSSDGRLLVTRTGGEAGGDGPLAVYDTRDGTALQTGVADDELAIDATLGPHQTVTYLIARKADRPLASDSLRASFAGSLQLRTCQLSLSPRVAPVCALVTDIPVSGISPMLAH